MRWSPETLGAEYRLLLTATDEPLIDGTLTDPTLIGLPPRRERHRVFVISVADLNRAVVHEFGGPSMSA
ncbi:hypothetical protein EAH80_30170 [Mycobacterium hodleri]|uniref:Uncharacterized protein n=1 Tax=Mycolicibacterium hodleri TaxID=49897 RepID=A0A502DK36_9MYCO|nr:hypothetical protein EAH80_30170 [Mycolicibacterium hodleri]